MEPGIVEREWMKMSDNELIQSYFGGGYSHYDTTDKLVLNRLYKILDKYDDRTLLNLCMANKKTNEFCKNDMIWEKRYVRRYGNTGKPVNMTWRKFYLSKLAQ